MKPQSHRIAALTSVLILVLAPGARGQCPGGSFHQMNSLPGINGYVYATTVLHSTPCASTPST